MREFIEEGEGSKITPSVGAAAPRRRGAGVEKGREGPRCQSGLGGSSSRERCVGPSSARPRLKSREKSGRGGREGEDCEEDYSEARNLRETQRKTKG